MRAVFPERAEDRGERILCGKGYHASGWRV